MIRCLYAVLCQRALTDQHNHASLIQVIELLKSPSFPFLFPGPAFTFLLSREEGDPQTIDVTLRFEREKDEFESPVVVDFQDKLRSRTIASIENFSVKGPGTLNISVLYDGKKLATWPVQVEQVATPEPEVRTESESPTEE